MADILQFPGMTTVDLPPDDVLEAALGALADCVVIGRTHDGGLWISSSNGRSAEVNYLLDMAKFKFLQVCAEDISGD
jgi:hypothetical protein